MNDITQPNFATKVVRRFANHSRLFAAPCLWCNYNGPGYLQTGTHEPWCPWHGIGGEIERKNAAKKFLLQPTG